MSLKKEFKKMILELSEKHSIPPISSLFIPPFYKGGQPKDAQFMAICLEGGAAGISYVLIPDNKMDSYNSLNPADFIGKKPDDFALEFGDTDPVKEMVSLAAINAICQHVMKETRFEVESAVDSLGLLSISAGDRVGMVGLFYGMVQKILDTGAELIVIEKNEELIKKFPDLPVTLDPARLSTCNKVLCTSTTVLNNSLDNILSHCSPETFVSVVGPTAGYFPDPLFARGVDVVGGRVVTDGEPLIQQLEQGKKWGNVTQRTCFQKTTYTGIVGI